MKLIYYNSSKTKRTILEKVASIALSENEGDSYGPKCQIPSCREIEGMIKLFFSSEKWAITFLSDVMWPPDSKT